MERKDQVALLLSPDQALVFFDWLSREDGRAALPVAHEAEQAILWELEGQLERALVAPLKGSYAAGVVAARERVAAGQAGQRVK